MQQTEKKSLQPTASTSLPSSRTETGANSKDDSTIKQLKARILNVEKSYEHSKNKVKLLEEDSKLKDLELKKREDDIVKLKTQKNKLLKEVQTQKQAIEVKDKFTIDDLIPTKEFDMQSE